MKKVLLLGLFLVYGFCFGQDKNTISTSEKSKEYREEIIPVLLNVSSDNDQNRRFTCFYAAPVLIFEDNLNVTSEFFNQGQDFARKIYDSSDKKHCINTLLEIKRLCKNDLLKIFTQANVLTIAFVFNSAYKDDYNKIRNTQSTYSIKIQQLKEENFEEKLIK